MRSKKFLLGLGHILLFSALLGLPLCQAHGPLAGATKKSKTPAVPKSTLDLSVWEQNPGDPLGLSTVSGIYGPGNWGGWFITVCGSWIRVFSGESPAYVDMNLWAYLLYVNWAAIDLLRHSKKLGALRKVADPPSSCTGEEGAVGAAYTILYWGITTAIFQIAVLYVMLVVRSQKSKTIHFQNKQIWDRYIGLLVPVASVIASGLVSESYNRSAYPVGGIFERESRCGIPGIYWKGISYFWNPLTTYAVDAPGILFYLLACSAFHPLLQHYVRTAFQFVSRLIPLLAQFIQSLMESKGARAFCTAVLWIVYYLFMLQCVTLVFLWMDLPGLSLMASPFVLIFYLGIYVPGSIFVGSLLRSAIYVWKGYFFHSVPSSQSCFFMPCAPQSIHEWDQSGVLFAGLGLLVIGDIIPHVSQFLKNRKREREALEFEMRNVEDRIAAANVRRANTILVEEGGAGEGQLQRTTSGFETTGSVADRAMEPTRRINSGIDE